MPHDPTRLCLCCERPVASHVTRCVYCGESMPRPLAARILRPLALMIFCAGTMELVFLRLSNQSWAACMDRVKTPTNAALLAVGVGLALLPPSWRGVATWSWRDRIGFLFLRIPGTTLLALFTGLAVMAVGTPHPWSLFQRALAAAAFLALAGLPNLFGARWNMFVAGLLLGTAMLV